MKKTALLLLLTGMVFAVPSVSPAQGNNNNNGQNQNQDNEEDEEEDEEKEDEKSTAEEGEGPKRFWQATLPGGNYMVAIDHISSISIHEYVLDAQLLVNEVVVDTNGRALARFYHVAPVAESAGTATTTRVLERGRQLVDQAGQRAGTDIHNLAQKNYPTTSHSGMIEYRILNLSDLKALYKNLQSAWETGKGKTITIR